MNLHCHTSVGCFQMRQELMEALVQRHSGVTAALSSTCCHHYGTTSINLLLGVCYQRRARMTRRILLTVHCLEMWAQHLAFTDYRMALDLLKQMLSLNLKLWVDLPHYCCHLEKLIWRHNSAGGGLNAMKFGRPLQNHIPTMIEMWRLSSIALVKFM